MNAWPQGLRNILAVRRFCRHVPVTDALRPFGPRLYDFDSLPVVARMAGTRNECVALLLQSQRSSRLDFYQTLCGSACSRCNDLLFREPVEWKNLRQFPQTVSSRVDQLAGFWSLGQKEVKLQVYNRTEPAEPFAQNPTVRTWEPEILHKHPSHSSLTCQPSFDIVIHMTWVVGRFGLSGDSVENATRSFFLCGF